MGKVADAFVHLLATKRFNQATSAMPIHFRCEQCGQSVDVDEGLQGRSGQCRHCGQPLVVPDRRPGEDAPLRLRPLAANEPSRAPAHLLDAQELLNLRPVESGPAALPAAWSTASRPGADLLDQRGPATYEVSDPFGGRQPSRPSGPPSYLMILPTRIGRHVAHMLVKMRDLLSIISAVALLSMLLGYLFKVTLMLHLGAVVIITANIGLLVVSTAYIVALPFRDGLMRGVTCLLIPPYFIYFMVRHRRRLRRPIRNTLQAFVPILLAGIAYFFYHEGPTMKAAVEKELPPIEQKIERELDRLDPWSGHHKQEPAKIR